MQIRQNLYLLINHPANYQEVLERLPIIGVQPVCEVVKTRPKLLMRPIEKVLKTIEILKVTLFPINFFFEGRSKIVTCRKTLNQNFCSLPFIMVF